MFKEFEEEVQELEAKTFTKRESVVFYGSSSIRIWDTLAGDIGPLTGKPERPIINVGFGGSTIASCVHYFDRLVGRIAQEQGPLRSLLFYAGENDLGQGQSVEDVFAAYADLQILVQERLGGIPFAFLAIKPSPGRANVMDNIIAFNELVRDDIAKHPHSIYVDLYTTMLDANGIARQELWSEDGVHLSRAGYEVWTQTLALYKKSLFL